MNCRIIFYMAKKTNLCEKALVNTIEKADINIDKLYLATTPSRLGEALVKSLSEVNLIFIVGGINPFSHTGIENILSNALSNHRPDEAKRIKSDSSCDGYLIRKDNQIIVVLPDEPSDIYELLGNSTREYIKSFC